MITRRWRRWPTNRKVVRSAAGGGGGEGGQEGGQGIGKWSGGRAAGGGGLARATANRSDTHLTHSPAKPKSPHSMETFSSGEDFLHCILHNVW